MNTQVRDRIFETNSSSTHSLTLVPDEIVSPRVPPQALRNGVIVVHPGQYGWEWRRYYRFENKLAYLLTDLAGHAFDDNKLDEDFTERLRQQNDQVDDVLRLVENVTGCTVKIEPTYGDRFEAYIDHDSHGVAREAMADDETLITFLFSDKNYVQTGNDNTPPGEFIETDLDEKEPAWTDVVHTAPVGEHVFTLVIDDDYNDHTIRVESDTHGAVTLTDPSYRETGDLIDAISKGTCIGGSIAPVERRRKGLTVLKMTEQSARDQVFQYMETFNAYRRTHENQPDVLGVLKDAEFSGEKSRGWTPNVYALQFSTTPAVIEQVFSVANELVHNREVPKP